MTSPSSRHCSSSCSSRARGSTWRVEVVFGLRQSRLVPLSDYRKLFDLAGRTALVVGAGSGIGEACAEGLAAFGARVTCADLDLEAAQRTAEAIGRDGGASKPLRLDMRDADSCAAALSKAGAPDALVITPAINVRKRA